MASDEVVWDLIGHSSCSFKLKTTKDRTFCRSPHNLTGLCLRQACPLANSRYATIRSSPTNPAILYLYTKTPERAHLPNRLWEKQQLPRNYAEALQLVDDQLQYWPKFLVHKCKQRLTRLTQVAIRSKRIAREERRIGEKIVPRMAGKIRRREETRERKAEKAARVEREVERELLERLRSGAYGEAPVNVDEKVWRKVLQSMERSGEGLRDEDVASEDEMEEEMEEEREKEMELEDEGNGMVEYVSDLDESDDEDLEDFDGQVGAGGKEEWGYSDEEDEASGDDDDDDSEGSAEEDQDETANLKSLLANLKRQPPGATPKTSTNGSKRGHDPKPQPPSKKRKGPKRQIGYEYEMENEAPLQASDSLGA